MSASVEQPPHALRELGLCSFDVPPCRHTPHARTDRLQPSRPPKARTRILAKALSALAGLGDANDHAVARSALGQDTNGIDTTQARRLQLQRHIRANLADPRLSPTQIADALHVSRRTLYAALAPDDQGIAAEIQRQRLDRAHAMLQDPTHPRSIADIAASVGLPNPAHFSRLFRARYCHPPSELRHPTPQPNPAETPTAPQLT